MCVKVELKIRLKCQLSFECFSFLILCIPLEMSCTIEKALADAKALVERLRDHDDAAESLIEQTTALNKRVEAMKQV